MKEADVCRLSTNFGLADVSHRFGYLLLYVPRHSMFGDSSIPTAKHWQVPGTADSMVQ
jgi:hypothetical protein